jgi:hypothetical protein
MCYIVDFDQLFMTKGIEFTVKTIWARERTSHYRLLQ